MTLTLLVLVAIAPIGAIDVLYYHLYRFRLFERSESAAEELTHLVRSVVFVVAVLLLARGVDETTDRIVLALLVADLVNSALDVWLEPRSRAALGGLPRGEYLLHFLGTFGSGLAAATYLFERTRLPLAPATGWLAQQSVMLVVTGALLFTLEAGLFARARWRARARRGDDARPVGS